MRCPYCGADNDQVKDTRPTEDGATIRRRWVCADCGGRFTTIERVQLRDIVVVKKSGRRVPFDRDKLMRSVQVALRKRPVEPERVERMVSTLLGVSARRGPSGDGETDLAHLFDDVGLLMSERCRRAGAVAELSPDSPAI